MCLPCFFYFILMFYQWVWPVLSILFWCFTSESNLFYFLLMFYQCIYLFFLLWTSESDLFFLLMSYQCVDLPCFSHCDVLGNRHILFFCLGIICVSQVPLVFHCSSVFQRPPAQGVSWPWLCSVTTCWPWLCLVTTCWPWLCLVTICWPWLCSVTTCLRHPACYS